MQYSFYRLARSLPFCLVLAAQRRIQTLTFKKQIPIVFMLLLSAGISSPAQSFNDEFDGTAVSLDTSGDGVNKWHWRFARWNVSALSGNSDDYFKMWDGQSYNGGPSVQSALQGAGYGSGPFLHQASTLKLRAYPAPAALKNSIWGYPYVASMISTELSHNFKMNTPGSIEFRYRNKTIDKGTHVAAWLLDINGDWPPEIDIVETMRTDVNGAAPFFFYNAHGAPTGPTVDYGFDFPGVTVWEDWHVFRLEWTPSELTWMRDGVVWRKQANYLGSRSMYFLLTLEGASNWPGDPNSTTRWPQEAEIDYVRIRSDTGSPPITSPRRRPKVRLQLLEQPKPSVRTGEQLTFCAAVHLGGLAVEDVVMECLVESERDNRYVAIETHRFTAKDTIAEGKTRFERLFRSANLQAAPVPLPPDLDHRFATGLMKWI